MPIPSPNTGESRSNFIGRCVSFLVNEGRSDEQAFAICYDQYQEANKAEEAQKARIWKAFDNKRKAFESYATDVFHKALKKSIKPYLDEVIRTQSFDVDIDLMYREEPIVEAYEKVYLKVMKPFALETYNQYVKKAKKTGVDWEKLIKEWLKYNTTRKIVGVSNYTKQRVLKQVELALIGGLSVDDFARRILPMDFAFSMKRARRIGRTEIIAGSNMGSLMGAKESGTKLMKKWLSSRDDRVRTHFKGNEWDHYAPERDQAIPLDDPFVLTSIEGKPNYLLAPSDDSLGADAGNTINCRCTQIYVEPEKQTPDQLPVIETGADVASTIAQTQVAREVVEEVFEELQQEVQEQAVRQTAKRKSVEAKHKFRPINENDLKDPSDMVDHLTGDFMDDLMKVYETNYRYRRYGDEDSILTNKTFQQIISEIQGFDGLGSTVSRREFLDLVEEGGKIPMYRSVGGYSGWSQDVIDEALDQLRNGKMYHGEGLYGDGTYFGGRTALTEVIDKYGGGNKNSIISSFFDIENMKWHNTRHQVADSLNKLQRSLQDDFLDYKNGRFWKNFKKRFGNKEIQFDSNRNPIGLSKIEEKFVKAYEDIIVGFKSQGSELYTALGYDAIYVSGRDYWIVLNRTKLTFWDQNGVIEIDPKFFEEFAPSFTPSRKP